MKHINDRSHDIKDRDIKVRKIATGFHIPSPCVSLFPFFFFSARADNETVLPG